MTIKAEVLKETLNRIIKENGGIKTLGMAFYKRLFEKYPGVKHLFKTPPEEQHKKLMASIGAIVTGVENTEKLIPYLQAMAIRHLDYETEEGHYGAVGENLLTCMKDHLSVEGDWTQEMESEWTKAYRIISNVMIDAANNPSACTETLTKAGYDAKGYPIDKSKEIYAM